MTMKDLTHNNQTQNLMYCKLNSILKIWVQLMMLKVKLNSKKRI